MLRHHPIHAGERTCSTSPPALLGRQLHRGLRPAIVHRKSSAPPAPELLAQVGPRHPPPRRSSLRRPPGAVPVTWIPKRKHGKPVCRAACAGLARDPRDPPRCRERAKACGAPGIRQVQHRNLTPVGTAEVDAPPAPDPRSSPGDSARRQQAGEEGEPAVQRRDHDQPAQNPRSVSAAPRPWNASCSPASASTATAWSNRPALTRK